MLPLDAHAHIQPDIAPRELELLRACVLAATRSLDEYDQVASRDDPAVAWGVGCHPGLAKSIRSFDVDRFCRLLETSAVVAEIGLDGSSRVPIAEQITVFEQALTVLAASPRLASVHSFAATAEVVELIERYPAPGIILHWWLGTEEETARAIDAGAYFSLNASQARRWTLVGQVPHDRLLLETDHPFGDRQSKPQRPGNLEDVERRLATVLHTSPQELRQQTWRNLKALVANAPDAGPLLPREFQVQLLAA